MSPLSKETPYIISRLRIRNHELVFGKQTFIMGVSIKEFSVLQLQWLML
jgi:hypothetical protein